MSDSFFINTLPADEVDLINCGIHFLEQSMREGRKVHQVFFYGKAARQALVGSKTAKSWQAFSQKHSVPLCVCANSAVSRGVLDAALAQEQDAAVTMDNSFQVSSLVVAFEQMINSDKIICLEQPGSYQSEKNTLAVVFDAADKTDLDFNDGLEFVLLAASLDWQVTVVFKEERCFDQSLKDLFTLYEIKDVKFYTKLFVDENYKLV